MAQKTHIVQVPSDSSLQHASSGGSAGFKPVALRALAAAVEAGKRSGTRASAHREVPPILREAALTD